MVQEHWILYWARQFYTCSHSSSCAYLHTLTHAHKHCSSIVSCHSHKLRNMMKNNISHFVPSVLVFDVFHVGIGWLGNILKLPILLPLECLPSRCWCDLCSHLPLDLTVLLQVLLCILILFHYSVEVVWFVLSPFGSESQREVI